MGIGGSKGSVCTNRPVRQDYLDQFVWNEIIGLLEDPALVQAEIDRRQEVARNADPLRRREEELHREQARLEKSTERLVSAYQEGLVTLPQLRHRMPDLRKQAQAIESDYNPWRWPQWTKPTICSLPKTWEDSAESCACALIRWMCESASKSLDSW